jgi:peptidase C25-like protein/type IX secretion system substrate protein
MKKTRHLLLLVLVLSGSFLYAQVIEKTFYFDPPEIRQAGQYQTVQFDSTQNCGEIGKPTVPYRAIKLLLPPGHAARSMEIIKEEKMQIEGQFELFPVQPIVPLSKVASGDFIKNQEIYDSDVMFPFKATGDLSTQYLNGYALALSTFTPIEYNPARNDLYYYAKITVRLKLEQNEPSLQSLNNLKSSPKIQNRVASFCQNPEMLDQYPEGLSLNDDYHMLIITKAEFEEDFQALADLYLPRGIVVKIATTENINNNTSGQDLEEKIRNHITQEYQDHSIEYVLLGGDVEFVPHRGFYCYVSAEYNDDDIPSDIYFAALDGNWNNDSDEKWAEPGEEDLLPEISVGRLSFSDQEELQNMLHKTTSYQDSPVLGEMEQLLLVGQKLSDDPLTWGADFLDLLVGYQDMNGYETTGIPESNNYDSLYDRNASWSQGQLLTEINSGRSFIHHSGHAHWHSLMRLSTSDVTNDNFYNVNGIDHNYSLVYTHGCTCGAFDKDDCIAEYMARIDNFLAAGIFNSRYGWYTKASTEGPSAHLHREFIDALYAQNIFRIGETHKTSKIESVPWVMAPGQVMSSSLRWVLYDNNLLGDPALAIWTAEPLGFSVSHPYNIKIGDESFNVTVQNDSNQAMQGMSCTFLQNDVFCGIGTSDENGLANVVYDPSKLSLGAAMLIVSGNNCIPQYFEIMVVSDNGAFVVYDSHQLNDISGNYNQQADYGENIFLSIVMSNIGDTDASQVEVEITQDDNFITITDAEENYNEIPVGQTINVQDGFRFLIQDSIPDQHQIIFRIEATGAETWISVLSITLNAPVLDIGEFEINDAYGGNGDGIIDPGETIQLTVNSYNNGHSKCFNTFGKLSCSSSFIHIPEPIFEIGELDIASEKESVFILTVDENTPEGEIIELSFLLDSNPYKLMAKNYSAIGVLCEDFETGNFDLFDWQFMGNAAWAITSNEPYEGVYCAKSSNIGPSCSSELSIYLNVLNDGEISFYRKTSSEQNKDFLVFYMDDVELEKWSGEAGWERFAFDVPSGTHYFRWAYEKNEFNTTGLDRAWLDYIVLPVFSNTVDVAEFNPSGISIFPNPANSSFFITGTSSENASCTIEICDFLGRKILERPIALGEANTKINTQNWEKGMYFVLIISENKTIESRKVIIQ